jgi:hypothetical protein
MGGNAGRIEPVQGLNARISFRGNLSPLRGEGAAIGNRSYLGVVRHSDDGAQRTARPTIFCAGGVIIGFTPSAEIHHHHVQLY